MRHICILYFVLWITNSFAQTHAERHAVDRKGFVIGFGIGAGLLTLNQNDSKSATFSTTLPNLKLGLMVNKRLALLATLPGANYKYNGKDRGFEALVIAGQYWVRDNLWVLGGSGLTFDAPAFYTVKEPKSADFNIGLPALTFATGYEIWHKGRFGLDLQYRLFFGKSNLPNDTQRKGISNMFVLGFNWY